MRFLNSTPAGLAFAVAAVALGVILPAPAKLPVFFFVLAFGIFFLLYRGTIARAGSEIVLTRGFAGFAKTRTRPFAEVAEVRVDSGTLTTSHSVYPAYIPTIYFLDGESWPTKKCLDSREADALAQRLAQYLGLSYQRVPG